MDQIVRIAALVMVGFIFGGVATAQPGPGSAKIVEANAEPTPLAAYAYHRQVGIRFSVDLKRNNRHATAVAKSLQEALDPVNSCYTRRLDAGLTKRGSMSFAFVIDKASGAVKSVVRKGGKLADRPLELCVRENLKTIVFQVPGDLAGTVNYRFDYKQFNSTPQVIAAPAVRARPTSPPNKVALAEDQ
jgi:hypothetical protein